MWNIFCIIEQFRKRSYTFAIIASSDEMCKISNIAALLKVAIMFKKIYIKTNVFHKVFSIKYHVILFVISIMHLCSFFYRKSILEFKKFFGLYWTGLRTGYSHSRMNVEMWAYRLKILLVGRGAPSNRDCIEA